LEELFEEQDFEFVELLEEDLDFVEFFAPEDLLELWCRL